MNNQFDFIQGSKKHVEQAIARYEKNMAWLETREDQKSLLMDLKNISNPPTLVFDENNYGNVKVANTDLYEIKEQGSEKYYKKLSNKELGFTETGVHDISAHENQSLSDLLILKYYLLNELSGLDTANFKCVYGGPEWNHDEWDILDPDPNNPLVNMIKLKAKPKQSYRNAFISTIVGVGLGYHMKEFMDRTNPNLVFITDVSNIYIYLSLFCVNYKSMFEKITDGNLMIRTSVNANKLFHEYREFIYDRSRIAFFHAAICVKEINYFSKSFMAEVYGNRVALNSLYGFLSDQLAMHINTVFNIKHGKTLITARNYKLKDTPVFIVGSGPSVSYDLDFLKKNKDKALIVACGSSLDFLLKNDIKPDFYVWLERDISWHDVFINKDIDLKNVVLLSPITTIGTQGINRLIRTEQDSGKTLMRSIFPIDFKCEIASTRMPNSIIWDQDNQYTLSFEGSTVTNLALGFMEHFNFHNIYLFGLDFGKKGMLDHHVQAVKEEYSAKGLELLENSIEISSQNVPANFGGITTTMHPYSRGMQDINLFMNAVKKEKSNLNVYNCSDGVYLEKTIATFSESITLEELTTDKETIINELYHEQQAITPTDIQTIWKDKFIKGELETLISDIKQFYKNVDWFSADTAENYHKILSKPSTLSQNILGGTLYDTFAYGLAFMQRLPAEYLKKGQKIITKYILLEIDKMELFVSIVLTALNVYLLKDQDLPIEHKKDVLLGFKNKFPKFKKDQLGVSRNYLNTRYTMNISVFNNAISRSKLKLLSENYYKYLNEGTAINILTNGLQASFVSVATKKKLFKILKNWITSTKNDTLISTIDEIYHRHFQATPVISPFAEYYDLALNIFISENIPADYKEYLLKQLNIIDEYNSIEKLSSLHRPASEYAEQASELYKLICAFDSQKDYHYLMDPLEVFFDIIRKPMDVEDARFLLFAEEALPVVADYYLENHQPQTEYNLLEDYYNLIEEQIHDPSINFYERSNTMAMDWALCAIIEEKVLDQSLHKDILSTDIYKQTFKINIEVVNIISTVEYFHYSAGWNAKFSFDINMDKNIETIQQAIKLNRLLLTEWKNFILES